MGEDTLTMSNRKIVEAFWDAFSAGRMEEAMGQMADDATWWVLGTTVLSGKYSKQEFVQLLEKVGGLLPHGLTVTPLSFTCEGDRVAMEAVSHGEVSNGRTYKNTYHFLHVLREGKLVEIKEYLDTEHVTEIFGP